MRLHHRLNAFLGKFTKLQKATISFVISVCRSKQNNLASTGWIFMKPDISVFFEKSVKKIQDLLKSDKSNGYFT